MKQFPKSRVERKWLPLEVYKRRKIDQGDMDAARATFLDKLEDSDLMLTDWETAFVGSYREARSDGRWQEWFTDGRRASADKMREKYGDDLGLPSTRRESSPKVEIAQADPAGCMYLVRGEGGLQRPCNEPAHWQTKQGFRYCDAHEAAAAEACRRKKVGFSVLPINRQNGESRIS